MSLEQDIQAAVLEKNNPQRLQKMIDYIGHKYTVGFVASDKGLAVIKPLIAKMYAGNKLPQKELELLYMLSRPSVDVDLFPNEFETVNNMEKELVENHWHISFLGELNQIIKTLCLEYVARGLMEKNPVYDPRALEKLKEVVDNDYR